MRMIANLLVTCDAYGYVSGTQVPIYNLGTLLQLITCSPSQLRH